MNVNSQLFDGPKLRTILITPEMAIELLQRHNTHNRTVRQPHVDTLARVMQGGMWALNGEAIKIAKDGTILDGQHRLLAVVLSGVSIWSVLVENLESDTQSTMDAGLKRSNGDHFRLAGEKDAFSLSAVIRASWQWEYGDQSYARHSKPTQPEMADFLDKNPGLRRSNEIAGRTYHGFRFLSKTAYGVAHHLITQVDEKDAYWPEFFTRIEDGAELSSGNPILTMRKRTMSDRDNRVRLLLPHQIGYLTYTWNRWRDYVEEGKSLYKFGYRVTDSVHLPIAPGRPRQGELDESRH